MKRSQVVARQRVLMGAVGLALAVSSLAVPARRASGQARTATPIPAVLPAGRAAPLPPERYRNLARALLAELVGINTTNSSGDNTRAAEAMKARMLAAGFAERDMLVVAAAPRKGNLVVRLRGRDSTRKPILLLSHIDVVEADPADWTLPPFELVERDGVFYGRGTADDKDESAIHLATIIRMKEEGYVPSRDIVVALTADEEGGGSNGVRLLLAQHREWVDAEYVINEGGGGVLDEKGARVANTVQAAEKSFQNFSFEVLNPGGHSSRPRPDNAIYELAQALVRVGGFAFPIRLTEVTREYLRREAENADAELATAMRAILRNPRDGAADAVLARDTRLNSMLRTTCVPTMLEGGHASNALPQRARATVNCRVHPDDDPAYVRETLASVADVPTLDVSGGGRGGNNPTSPLTPEILQAIEEVTEAMWPGVPVIPTMGTGATDGRYFRMEGIPTYGVSGLFYGETGSHGMNERVPVQSFYEGQEFIYRLVRRLTSPVVP